MKFFLDTASLKDISWAAQAGLIDGITTNPSLLAKQAGDLDPRDVLKEICSLVEGPVSAEVVAVDTDGMLREGKQLAKIATTSADTGPSTSERSEEHTSELQSPDHLVCRLLLEK